MKHLKKYLMIDLDRFKSGEYNILLITGLIASGKTTLANQLALKYNAKVISLDNVNGFSNSYNENKKYLLNIINKYRKDKKNKYIIEGVQIFWLLNGEKDINNCSLICINTSLFKRIIRRYKRAKDIKKIKYKILDIMPSLEEYRGYKEFKKETLKEN